MTPQTDLFQSDDEKRADEFAREVGIAKNFLLKASLKNAGQLAKQLDGKNQLSIAAHKQIQDTLLAASRTVAQVEELAKNHEKSDNSTKIQIINSPSVNNV